MRVFLKAIVSIGLLYLGTDLALCADVTPRPPVITAESVMPDETSSGWYLRGDVGYSLNVAPTLSWSANSFNAFRTSNGGSFDVGIGYRFSNNIRTDLALDLWTRHRIYGSLAAGNVYQSSQQASSLLVNGYYDFKAMSGFSPYLGVGLGLARLSSGQLAGNNSVSPSYSFPASIKYSLATAAMAGVSFDLGHGMQADVGYRYMWLGKVQTGSESHDPRLGQVNIGDSASHQFRVGLRYFIN